MPAMDVVVTIAKKEWLLWLAEGDLPGEPATGEWGLYFGHGEGRKPAPPKHLQPGDRVYVVAHGFVRGYAPLVRAQDTDNGYALVRAGGAVACTVVDTKGQPMPVSGFQGVRYRWWEYAYEAPFADWQTQGLTPGEQRYVERLVRLRQDPVHRAKLQSKALARVLGPTPKWDRFLREFPS